MRFYALMDGFLPQWRRLQDELNFAMPGAPVLDAEGAGRDV